jgi:hypothetical protein
VNSEAQVARVARVARMDQTIKVEVLDKEVLLAVHLLGLVEQEDLDKEGKVVSGKSIFFQFSHLILVTLLMYKSLGTIGFIKSKIHSLVVTFLAETVQEGMEWVDQVLAVQGV